MGKLALKPALSNSAVYMCPICHNGLPMLRVPQASRLFELKPHTIYGLVRKLKLHATRMVDDSLWVCQLSLKAYKSGLGISKPKNTTAALARQAIELIYQRHREPGLTLRSIVSALGKSLSHTDRVLKSALGMGFRAYVKGLRLQGVTNLLHQPLLAIKEIAAELGYKSASDLDHHFKARYGVSPSEYRSALMKADKFSQQIARTDNTNSLVAISGRVTRSRRP